MIIIMIMIIIINNNNIIIIIIIKVKFQSDGVIFSINASNIDKPCVTT